ncbi:MAG: hypothetical protein KKB02_06290 [Alphaproteobacteria bacterium]|nr:hypothetical protein [Alphaproteobacteria bacterium]
MRVNSLILMVSLLAGCGGGGGGAGSGGLTPDAIDESLGGLPISNPADLPATGRAEYGGYMRARLPTGPDGARVQYLGDLQMDVNFGAGFDQIRGRATGFEAADTHTLDGALTITNGAIYRDTNPDAAYSFDGDVDGTLSDASGRYAVDAQIEGEFLGTDQKAVSGLLFGDVTGPAGLDVFDGTFAGTRRAN